jgi:hypothetical protein
MLSISNFSAAMSLEPQPAVKPEAIAAALAAVRHSRPEDYDGHTEFARLTPDARLAWLEAAVRFVQSSKAARPLTPSK